MIEIKSGPGMILPRIPDLNSLDDKVAGYLRSLDVYVRLLVEELHDDINSLAKALSGDSRDVVTVLPQGDAEEVHELEHSLGYPPTRFSVVALSGGFVQVTEARAGDVKKVYFRAVGPPGSVAVVRVW